MLRRKCVMLLISLVCVLKAEAGFFDFESAGARWGLGGNQSSRHFNQVDAFADWKVPWEAHGQSGWWLITLIQGSGGVLWQGGRTGAIFTLGPALRVGCEPVPLFLEGGISPKALTRTHYESKELGSWIQFTSHIGVGWDITEHYRLGYRYQHMSNARISGSNPGLNLHVVAFSYSF